MDSKRGPVRRNRRTHQEMLFDACCEVPDHRPTRDELRALLPKVSEVQFLATLQRALEDPDFPLDGAPGGRYYRFYGTEGTGSVGRVGLYSVVATKLKQGWGPRRGMRHIEVFDTARSGRRDGAIWVQPDLVLQEQRRRARADDPLNLVFHTFEIERSGAFDLASVYQAHAQGRGADFSWVAFHELGRLADRARIMTTASELGVGVVAFTSPNNLETWRTTIEATRRYPTADERALFHSRVMPQDAGRGPGAPP